MTVEQNPTQLLTVEIVPAERPDVKIVKLTGPLTIHNYFEFQELTRKQPFPALLLIDLTEVPYIDSAALGTFVGIHVSSEESGRKYALIGANERLTNLFELTQAKAFLVTYDTTAEAIEHLA